MATEIINGRAAIDLDGIAERTGMTRRAVEQWIDGSAADDFPAALPESIFYDAEAVDTWWATREQRKLSRLTTGDRSGDPNELVNQAQVARICGYKGQQSLSNSSVWAKLLERNDPADNQELPGGGVRLRWPRSVAWEIADSRTGRAGRPRATPSDPAARGWPRITTGQRRVDRSGDPDDLVGTTEAARVLGYPRLQSLPAALLDRADEVEGLPSGRRRRKFKRSTLWQFADEATQR